MEGYFLAVSLTLSLTFVSFLAYFHLGLIPGLAFPTTCIQRLGHLLLTILLPACLGIRSITWSPALFSQSVQADSTTHHVCQGNPRTLESSRVGRVSPRLRTLNFYFSWTTPPHIAAHSARPQDQIPALHSLHVLCQVL